MIKFSVKALDKGFARLRQTIAMLKTAESYAKVGVLASSEKGSKDRGDLTLAEIAAVHEFGSRDGTIPERSFIRSTLTAKQGDLGTLLKPLLIQLYSGNVSVKKVLDILGMFLAVETQKALTAGLSPPTKRGEGKPLIDTGQLLQAISHEVILK